MTMGREKYNEIIAKVRRGWASDRITGLIETDTGVRTILTCENGTFIKIALMEVPEDAPAQMRDLMHNKLLIQWTDDLEASSYKNLARYIAKDEMPPEGSMREALQELAARVHIGNILG